MKSKSEQEELLRAMSNSVLGADYVFAPLVYSKGTHAREPADLVWACNNCLVLMYMVAKKYKKRSPQAHAQMRGALIEHNLKQARGWLRVWRKGGIPIEGKSARKSFSIAREDYKHIIVLSVIDCGDAEGTFHSNITNSLGITACATVPQSALLNIAGISGSMVDLIYLLLELSWADSTGSSSVNTNAILAQKQLHAIKEADPQKKWLVAELDANTKLAADTIRQLRAPHPDIISSGTGNQWELGRILNDMPLVDIYSLTCQIREGIELVGPNYKHFCYLGISCKSGYYLAVNLVLLGAKNFVEAATIQTGFEKQAEENGYGRGLINIIWECRYNQPITTALREGQEKKSYTETMADLLCDINKKLL